MPINSDRSLPGDPCDTVVVGAGLSGLAAARELRRRGLDVIVLEARDRLGGRVWTERFPGGLAELGAQWVGRDHRRVRRLAAELGVELASAELRGKDQVDLGRGATGGVTRPLTVALALADGAQLAARLWWLTRAVRRHGPSGTRGADRLDSTTFADWVEARAWTREGTIGLRHVAEGGTCASATEVSALEVAAQLAAMGGVRALTHADAFTVVGGVDQLASGLASDLPERIWTDHALEAISGDGEALRLRTHRGDVVCRDVVLAVPPATLGAIDVDPALGDLATRTPLELAPARVVKQVLVYESPWWRRRGLSGQADTPTREIDFLTDASGVGRLGVLVALSTGPRADVLLALDDTERRDRTLAHVDQVLGPAPGDPRCVLHHDWVADPWSLGGYASRRALGGWTSAAPQGCSGPLIHLAGTEHAEEWRSYMEGALDAAERAARSVMDRRSSAP